MFLQSHAAHLYLPKLSFCRYIPAIIFRSIYLFMLSNITDPSWTGQTFFRLSVKIYVEMIELVLVSNRHRWFTTLLSRLCVSKKDLSTAQGQLLLINLLAQVLNYVVFFRTLFTIFIFKNHLINDFCFIYCTLSGIRNPRKIRSIKLISFWWF
jgi:hypothetical protein